MLSQSEHARLQPNLPPVDAGDWAMIMAHRIGAPPLRFKGRQVFHRANDTLFITLWERKKGAFVLGYSDFQDQTVQPDARVVADIAVAATHLEACCPDDWTNAPLISNMAASFDGLQRALHYHHHFPFLVGDILAIWDEQIHPAPAH